MDAISTASVVLQNGSVLTGVVDAAHTAKSLSINPVTTISYQLPAAGRVHLKIFDLNGREVATLVEGEAPTGSNTIAWNGAISAGMFCIWL